MFDNIEKTNVPSQLAPLKPELHWHVYPSVLSVHVPSFRQGKLSQLPDPEKEINNNLRLIMFPYYKIVSYIPDVIFSSIIHVPFTAKRRWCIFEYKVYADIKMCWTTKIEYCMTLRNTYHWLLTENRCWKTPEINK